MLYEREGSTLKRVLTIIRNDERGQAMFIAALVIPIIFGLLGLAIDLGNFVLQREKFQNAVDITAIGAVQMTSINHGQVVSSAIEIGRNNGISTNALKINHPFEKDNNKVEIKASKIVRFFFLPIIGIHEKNFNVRAVAERKEKTIIETASKVFDYAVFSGSDSSTMTMRGNGSTVKGNVHSNANIRIMGNNHVINGNVTAVQGIQKFNTTINGSVNGSAPTVPMTQIDFSAYESIATKVFNTNQIFSGMEINGVWIVKGDCQIVGGKVTGKGILLVTGDLQIAGQGLEYNTGNDRLAIYVKGNIQITATGTNIKGVLYAPNGNIKIAGSGNNVFGALIANSIEWAGNEVMINPTYDLRTPASFTIIEEYTALVE
jgi:cytoskeletal protein CcmA (bactofilin family)